MEQNHSSLSGVSGFCVPAAWCFMGPLALINAFSVSCRYEPSHRGNARPTKKRTKSAPKAHQKLTTCVLGGFVIVAGTRRA